ncbi:MAG: hypothetical protein CVT85_07035 [Alphaproteobacteria bacterium HGW-Alphaproteobacteria-7]|jgi:hypothetical protein|nr:MAG: hypothetical protein CVT85_07035 [Alphaproteobacteria bacterium HGW-Alphaproteobacteria-7]PKP96812.1 MAG: hypothetical protein CVT76_05935 [Alphaproteobacteria bacterium HGW-Alphaproteobacteria-15]
MEAVDFLPYLGWIIGGSFVLGVAGILTSFQTTRMKIKNGYPLEGMWGQSLKPGSDAQNAQRVTLLTQENAELRAELGSLKDRMANVERIVTDGGYHLGAEIDALRDRALSNLKDKGEA